MTSKMRVVRPPVVSSQIATEGHSIRASRCNLAPGGRENSARRVLAVRAATAREAAAICRAEDRVECISMYIITAITRSHNNLAATGRQTDGRGQTAGTERVKTTRLISNNQRHTSSTGRRSGDVLVLTSSSRRLR